MVPSIVSTRVAALVAITATAAAGCALVPRGTREERRRLEAAGRPYVASPNARAVPLLPPEPQLHDLLAHAFAANAALEAAYFEWKGAVARIDVAAAYPNTKLSLSFAYLFSGENLKAWDRTTIAVGPDPMQNLAFPTKVLTAGRAALAEARAAGERFAAAKFDLQRRVLVAWTDYALLAEKIRLQDEAVGLARLVADTAARRVEAGGLQRELLRTAVELRLAEDERTRLAAELPQQQAALNALLGRPADAPLAPPRALPAPRPLPADDARLLAVAVEANPELAALAHERDGRREALSLARQQYIPDLNPFAGVTGSMEQMAGVALSLPARLPAVRGAVREARAALAGAEAMLRQGARDRTAAFLATLRALRDAERQTALVRERILPVAEQALQVEVASYATGGGGLGEVLEAAATLVELRTLAAEAAAGRERRLAELEALAGVDVETLAAPGAAAEVRS
jgi:outer membrane protein TolC